MIEHRIIIVFFPCKVMTKNEKYNILLCIRRQPPCKGFRRLFDLAESKSITVAVMSDLG